MNHKLIKCPECGKEIDLEGSIKNQITENIKKEMSADQAKLDEERMEFVRRKEEFDTKRSQAIKDYNQRLDKGMKEREEELRVKVESEVKKEHLLESKTKDEELAKKSKELQGFHKLQAENDKLKREKDEIESGMKSKSEIQTAAAVAETRKEQAEEFELERREFQKKLDAADKHAADIQKKNAQGSVKDQGTVQEEAIEDWLKANFNHDDIEVVKAGKNGADILQRVCNAGSEVGSIYYESKRTQSFSKSWIPKLKKDMQENGANIGVIVTQTMPKELPSQGGVLEGVYVCPYRGYQIIVAVLRMHLVKQNYMLATQENKEGKMAELYNWFSGDEFRSNVEQTVTSVFELKDSLARERASMQSIWKEREKLLEQIINSVANVDGEIKAITGRATYAGAPSLELPESSVISPTREPSLLDVGDGCNI